MPLIVDIALIVLIIYQVVILFDIDKDDATIYLPDGAQAKCPISCLQIQLPKVYIARKISLKLNESVFITREVQHRRRMYEHPGNNVNSQEPPIAAKLRDDSFNDETVYPGDLMVGVELKTEGECDERLLWVIERPPGKQGQNAAAARLQRCWHASSNGHARWHDFYAEIFSPSQNPSSLHSASTKSVSPLSYSSPEMLTPVQEIKITFAFQLSFCANTLEAAHTNMTSLSTSILSKGKRVSLRLRSSPCLIAEVNTKSDHSERQYEQGTAGLAQDITGKSADVGKGNVTALWTTSLGPLQTVVVETNKATGGKSDTYPRRLSMDATVTVMAGSSSSEEHMHSSFAGKWLQIVTEGLQGQYCLQQYTQTLDIDPSRRQDTPSRAHSSRAAEGKSDTALHTAQSALDPFISTPTAYSKAAASREFKDESSNTEAATSLFEQMLQSDPTLSQPLVSEPDKDSEQDIDVAIAAYSSIEHDKNDVWSVDDDCRSCSDSCNYYILDASSCMKKEANDGNVMASAAAAGTNPAYIFERLRTETVERLLNDVLKSRLPYSSSWLTLLMCLLAAGWLLTVLVLTPFVFYIYFATTRHIPANVRMTS